MVPATGRTALEAQLGDAGVDGVDVGGDDGVESPPAFEDRPDGRQVDVELAQDPDQAGDRLCLGAKGPVAGDGAVARDQPLVGPEAQRAGGHAGLLG